MANNWQINAIAGLDGTQSRNQLNSDIKKLEGNLDKLKLYAEIDKNQVTQLQNQLKNLQVQLNNVTVSDAVINGLVAKINAGLQNVNIGNINVGDIGNQTQRVSNNITQGFQQSTNAIESFRGSLSKVGKSTAEIDSIIDKVQKLNVQINSLRFSESTNGVMNVDVSGLDTLGNKVKVTQTLTQDLQNQLWKVSNTTTSLVSTKELEKINNVFTDYTAKLAQFKSTNTNILSGLTQPLADFESKLAGLKNGTVSIDEVKNAFKLLGAEASKITEHFTGQLSKTDAAIRKLAQGNEIMDKLKASFKGLNNAPKEITKELTSVSKLLQNVKNIEAKEGRTANWSEAYRKWADEVDKLQAKLSVLQKQQANMTTPQIFKTSDLRGASIPYMQKVSNTIEKQMPELQKMLNAHNWKLADVKGIEDIDGKIKTLTVTVRDAEGALKQFVMQRAKLQGGGKAQAGLMQVGDVKVLETASQAQAKLAQQTENANAKLQEQVNKIQLLSNGGVKNDYATQIAKLEGDFRSLGLAQDTITTKTQNVKNSLATLRAEFAKPVDQQNFQTIQTANDNLQRELIESRNEFEQLRASMKGMATEQQRLSLANTIEAWNQKNTAATKAVREENERYVITLRDLNTQMTRMQLGQINTAFKQTENSMRALNKLGASLKNQLIQAGRSFTTWLSASTLVMKTISETREAIVNIKELDNTLTEISKTSDMTSESLEKLGMSSYDTASKYGRTSSDYLSAFESMARSGFYDEVGRGMSELSLLAQAAGDMSQEVAGDYLLATNAAYKFGGDVEKLNKVLDGQNLITNRNSVSLEDMASAMSKAGTTAASYNVSVEDLSAMIGTMEAVTKSGGDEVGNSLKSILINLQNVTSSKIVGTLDKANASMTTFVDGAEKLRNPIEILRDLAKTFNELDEDDPLRAEILTNIGGKTYHVIQKCITRMNLIAGNA